MTAPNLMPRSVYAAKLRDFSDVAFANEEAFGHRGRWAEFFRDRIGPDFDGRIVLDLGCFDALFLAQIAAEHPQSAYVGIDWKCKAIYDGAGYIKQHGLGNVVLLRARGNDIHRIFAEAELDEIWLFHPDPCERESERKNRLVSQNFLLAVHATLKNRTSVLTLKTDHPDYFRSVLALLDSTDAITIDLTSNSAASCFNVTMLSEDYWDDAIAIAHTARRDFAGRRTLFERRFTRKSKPIFFLEIQKNKDRSP